MTDISAVVLTVGESTTDRALASLKRQTLPVKDVVLIENVSPFHKALNLGASRVRTEFFLQLDADMILDDCCVEHLRQCMADGVGIACGLLRDPLRVRTAAVKLFRRTCFDAARFKDTASPDTDFASEVLSIGWKRVFAIRFHGPDRSLWHTLGEHRPDYTPAYTFKKYLAEGRRYRYRNAFGEFMGHFEKLRRSDHEVALVAQLAMAHGVFLREGNDLLEQGSSSEEFRALEPVLESRIQDSSMGGISSLCTPRSAFAKAFRLGERYRERGSLAALQNTLGATEGLRDSLRWSATFGLCHGFFCTMATKSQIHSDYHLLEEWLGGERAWLRMRFGEKARRWVRRVSRRFLGRRNETEAGT